MELADRVVVAHPGHLRLIFRSKNKNDGADAGKLAKLLSLDEVPPVYVSSCDVRSWRQLIEYRRRLIAKRTRTKNSLRSILRTVGQSAPKEFGLWTSRGIRWLSQIDLPRLVALKWDLLIEELAMFERQITCSPVQKLDCTNPL